MRIPSLFRIAAILALLALPTACNEPFSPTSDTVSPQKTQVRADRGSHAAATRAAASLVKRLRPL